MQEIRIIRAQLGPISLHDVRHLGDHAIHDPDNYETAQQFGCMLWNAQSYGIHYQSVRADGACFGVLRPKVLSDAIHWRYLRYHYDQGSIIEVETLDDSGRR